jgi:predicted Rossmann-fold nucleotide-binding protein
MLEWIRATMLAEGKISPDDVDLLIPTDSPEEAVRVIVEATRKLEAEEARGEPATAAPTPASPDKSDAQ